MSNRPQGPGEYTNEFGDIVPLAHLGRTSFPSPEAVTEPRDDVMYRLSAAQAIEKTEGRRYDEPLLRFFKFAPRTDAIGRVNENFHALAQVIVDTLPRCPERTVALRKMLEAKDCAARAALPEE